MLAFGVIVVTSGIVITSRGDERASTTNVSRHPSSHCALEHAAHLARLQMAELFPRELGAVFAVDAIEKHHVKMWIEPQVGRCTLHHG